MCTAIAYRKKDHYFGRTLDVEFTFNEKAVITPRNYLFKLKNGKEYRNKFALIGIATVFEEYPMYYEAANEKGLAMAGLNFPGNAFYNSPKEGMENIAVFELIPWILGQAENLEQARELLERLNLTNLTFNKNFPSSPLHFMLSDRKGSIVAEPRENGIEIFENPYDVMTNNPPFQYHIWNMQRYLNLSPQNRENRFSKQYDLKPYAVGMGAEGLPGDTSSTSRFIRAAFNLTNSYSEDTEEANVSQFFHILDSVSMVKGATLTDAGKNDITLYSCCINADKGILYYKTYDNNQITAVRMHNADLDCGKLTVYALRNRQNIFYEN